MLFSPEIGQKPHSGETCNIFNIKLYAEYPFTNVPVSYALNGNFLNYVQNHWAKWLKIGVRL